MMFWEYITFVTNSPATSAILDQYGSMRYELVSVVYDTAHLQFVYYFKRESLERIA